MRRSPAFALALASLLPLAAPAAAGDAAVKEPPFEGTADFGLVVTSGNTETTTVNAGEKLAYRTGHWVFGQLFSLIYGKTDGEKSAEQWKVGGRAERELTARLGVFGQFLFDRDPFAGIDRRYAEDVGLGFKLINSESNRLRIEGGLSFTQQHSVTEFDNNFVAARAAALYRHGFTKDAYLQDVFEVLPNLEEGDDVRVNNELALVAPLSKRLAVKLGYLVKFDNLPEPGFDKTDQALTSGVQFKF